MTIQVSIVIPTYRRPALLKRCLQAVSSQDFDPSTYEVIVVDDGGDEDTRRLVEEWSQVNNTYAYLPGQEGSALWQPTGQGQAVQVRSQGTWVLLAGLPRLRYIPAPARHGPAAARNLGWRAAEGEIIAFTDDDCQPASDWLKKGVAAFRPGIQGVSGKVVVPLPPYPTDYEQDTAGLSLSEFVTANCFYLRNVLAAAGGFDESFTMAWREDSDLYFRLLAMGYCLAEAPEAVVIHPVRPAHWGVSLGQQRRSMFNALLFRKHPRLYRERIQPAPPWLYYGCLASLAMALLPSLWGYWRLAWLGACLWAGLTLFFSAHRLRHTSHHPAHIIEMLVTSAIIPPLSVYWRLRGALKYRVFFL